MTSTEAYLASSLVHCVNTILPLSACTITSCTTSVVMGQRCAQASNLIPVLEDRCRRTDGSSSEP